MKKFEVFTFSLILVLLVLLSTCSVIEATPGDNSTSPLDGTTWELVFYRKTAPIEGTVITATFDHGMVLGSMGCNTYGAPYTTEGNLIQVGIIEMTAEGCVEPEGIMEQEEYLTEFLVDAQSYRLEGERLYITRSNGETLTFEQVD